MTAKRTPLQRQHRWMDGYEAASEGQDCFPYRWDPDWMAGYLHGEGARARAVKECERLYPLNEEPQA